MPNTPQEDPRITAAKAALANANNFTNSVNQQAGVSRPPAHNTGVEFAAAHGRSHEGTSMPGMLQSEGEAQSIASGLAWRAQQQKALDVQ